MNELDVLIRQQAVEMAHPTRIYHWSRRSVAAPVSLDRVIGGRYGDAGPLEEVLVEGVNAWPADRFAPACGASAEELAAMSTTVVDELLLTSEDLEHYRRDWPADGGQH